MHRSLGDDPIGILLGGSRIIDKHNNHRVYTIRNVIYDNSMIPIYSEPTSSYEKKYLTTNALLKDNPKNKTILSDNPVLDKDNSLKVFEENEIRLNEGF